MEKPASDRTRPEPQRKHWGLLQWSVASGVILLLCLTLAVGALRFQEFTWRLRAVGNHGRDICLALKVWAIDHNDRFPDSLEECKTSNQVFRELVKDQIIVHESIFGCPSSNFVPDGVIGSPPNYAEAIAPGENHWMMVAGLSTSSPGRYPLFFENAIDASWPPKWRRQFLRSTDRGRAWPSGYIIMVLIDNSCYDVKLKSAGQGLLTIPEMFPSKTEGSPLPTLKVLDIEERK